MLMGREIEYYKDAIVSKLMYKVNSILLKPQWVFYMEFDKSYMTKQRTKRSSGTLEEKKGRRRCILLNIKLILKAMGLITNRPVGQNRGPYICGHLRYNSHHKGFWSRWHSG